METKKTALASLENKKKSFFLFGLLTALGFIFMAFEWAAFETTYELPQDTGLLVETEPAVKMIEIERPKPKRSAPPETQKTITTIVKIDNTLQDDTAQVIDDPFKDLLGDIAIDTSVDFGEPTAGPIKPDVPFKVVEEMPKYGKSDQDLFAYLGKKIKYTQYARELGIEGKVYVQFVIAKDASIQDVEVLRGLSFEEGNLEQNEAVDEAHEEIRNLIASIPLTTPAYKDGKKVAMSFVIPINMKLK